MYALMGDVSVNHANDMLFMCGVSRFVSHSRDFHTTTVTLVGGTYGGGYPIVD